MIYMNMIPAMTIKPNTINPIFPLRLSSFINHTKNPISGIRKIRKKMILGVLNIIQLFLGCIKISTCTLLFQKYIKAILVFFTYYA